MQLPLIEDGYRFIIAKNPNILAVRFVNDHPVEVISRDVRTDASQCILTREEILGDFLERQKRANAK
ncbi:MAG TPA: hypothetical protein VGQ53_08630 [Chitinophagaceae bacterium]|jgi:hypothetical protein|nr:hypothetical protein [Chitinophagaceae bacterium]